MKQNLLKTIAIGLLAMVGVNAWADRDPEKAIYCPVNDGSYDNIKEAYDAIKGNDATELEIQIWKNRPTMGTATSSRIDAIAGKTLSIVPKVSGVILTAGSHNRGNIWFLNAQDNATLNIGSSDYSMAIEGYGFNDNNKQLNAVCANEKKGVMAITNVTFQKFRFGTDNTKYGYVYANKVAATSSTEGFVTMTDVTITNCETDNTAFINSINTNSDAICLKGCFTMTHKEGKSEPVFRLLGRIKLGDKSSNNVYNDFTAPNLLAILWGGSATIGTNVIVKVPASQANGIFDIADENYGLVRSGSGGDMKLTQAYNLNVTSAGAATLVVPFAATIPSGATCYKLTYTSGDDITATSEAALTANSPVLVIADEGTYKFVSTATSGDLATGSAQTSAYGAMIGNYDANYVVPTDKYILTNKKGTGTLGFRKANGTNNRIQANRAYLDVTHTTGAPEFLGINFDGNVTAIDSVEKKAIVEDGEIYNLQGVRMNANNLPKGIYVKNGKKFVVK